MRQAAVRPMVQEVRATTMIVRCPKRWMVRRLTYGGNMLCNYCFPRGLRDPQHSLEWRVRGRLATFCQPDGESFGS